jgi:hypothetical protein
MPSTELAPPARPWSAAELRRLPPDQRDAALAAAAERAALDYTHDQALTAFEAFGPEDMHGDSADAGPR